VDPRNILVLGRRDHAEAMRVAAGLTLFGHKVRLVLMSEPLAQAEQTAAQVELLELAGVAPETTVAAMADQLPLLDAAGLAAAIRSAERVVNV
jgi:phosphohistidine phosphatase SixA